MDTIAVVDFGGQYTHLIANRVRRLGVYSEIVSPESAPEDLRAFKGIILSGSPHSVTDSSSPRIDAGILDLNIPILGLCYGHQLLSQMLGGTVKRGNIREYGSARFQIRKANSLLKGITDSELVWMSHGDKVEKLPEGFEVLGSSADCETAAVGHGELRLYGLQFHPEVTETPSGMRIIDNFLEICGVAREWNPQSFMKEIEGEIRSACGDRKVFLLVSGGVDSTVAFALLNDALGVDRVRGLHIDNGLMRYRETQEITKYMAEHGFDNLHIVDASSDFLEALKGISDPEKKREIIGNTFLSVQQKAQVDLGLNAEEWLLAQGTIYPDTIESAGTAHADRIKTHHNRVDIVLELLEKGLVVEPLSQLYKDEVRMLGEALGLPKSLVWRHPFPGPGLGVRTLCSSREFIEIDRITSDSVASIAGNEGYHGYVLPVRSVGVQGDGRTYAHPAVLSGPRDWEALERISTSITNSVGDINRVVYALHTEGSTEYSTEEGYLTRDRLDKLRLVDHFVTQTLRASGEYEEIWQMPVVLLPLLNAQGNECVVLRPIQSTEAMTARFVALRDETLDLIVDKVKSMSGIGDVFYDITHKPPGTIEWE